MTDKKTYKPNNKIEQVNADYGRVPPQAIELEEAVLGALMLEKNAVIEILEILKPESFYKESHQLIYKAIKELSASYNPIDILTVTEQLRKNDELEKAGGAYYITQLTSRIASGAHVEFHSRIIAQKFIQRELIRVTSEIQSKAYDDSIDVLELLNSAESALFQITQGNIKNETQSISDVIQKAITQIEEAGKREDGLSGVPSGFTSLDRITSGWQRSDMVIIAARPSMGKTAFVLSMARNMAVEHNCVIAFFSLEMAAVQLVNRLIIGETELPGEKIKNGKLTDAEWVQLDYKIKPLLEAQLFIDDTPAITIFELRAKCLRLKSQGDLDLVVIDYLQLMTGTSDTRGNREQEVSTISRGLKAIAKELDVPIIALSQLNRSVEMRSGDKRPQLSDLRESGAIEQDADIVIFIHRPEKYGLTEDAEGNSTKGLAEIIIAKHRNGPVTDVQLKFRDHLAKFEELENAQLDDIAMNDFGNNNGVTFGSKMNDDLPNQAFDLDDVNNKFEDNTPF